MGDEHIGRVIVGIDESLAGYQALRYAVEQARVRRAKLTVVRAFQCSGVGAQWSAVIREAAISEVAQAFAEALGGPPEDIDTLVLVVEGSAGLALVTVADRPLDLLVIGGSRRRRWRAPRTAVARVCARRAVCPVVIVPPPELACATSEARLAKEATATVERLLNSRL
jgi:nucleotide-binding universal stress UspA family protein